MVNKMKNMVLLSFYWKTHTLHSLY